jgi:hypothetical protein
VIKGVHNLLFAKQQVFLKFEAAHTKAHGREITK